MTDEPSILAGTALEDDVAVEPKLRPQTLSEYIGQTKVRENLAVFLAAADHQRPGTWNIGVAMSRWTMCS